MLPGLPDVAELQLLFAQYNWMHFRGEIPTYRIAYNARFSNCAGRITYKPPLIELSPKHLAGKAGELRETLLHEMIHAWLHALGKSPGHTATFKKKMASSACARSTTTSAAQPRSTSRRSATSCAAKSARWSSCANASPLPISCAPAAASRWRSSKSSRCARSNQRARPYSAEGDELATIDAHLEPMSTASRSLWNRTEATHLIPPEFSCDYTFRTFMGYF